MLSRRPPPVFELTLFRTQLVYLDNAGPGKAKPRNEHMSLTQTK